MEKKFAVLKEVLFLIITLMIISFFVAIVILDVTSPENNQSYPKSYFQK